MSGKLAVLGLSLVSRPCSPRSIVMGLSSTLTDVGPVVSDKRESVEASDMLGRILLPMICTVALLLLSLAFLSMPNGQCPVGSQAELSTTTLVDIKSDELSILELPRVSNDVSIGCRHFVIPAHAWAKQTKMERQKHPACLEEPWIVMQGDTAFMNKKAFSTIADSTNREQGGGVSVTCEFMEIIRLDDFNNVLLRPVVTSGSYRLKYSDALAVNCTDSFTGTQWKSVLLGASSSIFPSARAQAGWDFLPTKAAKLNILTWVLDSVSRNAFIRNLPRAWLFMQNHMKGILFRGYNIQGLNTAPNMMPLYFGSSFDDWHSKAKWKYLDDSPNGDEHLLRHFQKHGYMASYFEDFNTPPESGTFQYWYKLHGFRNPIGTHYSRNFMISYSRTTGISWNECYANVTANTFNQEYIKSLWTSYKDKPKMFISHSSLYSHHGEHLLQKIEEELLSFLQWLNSPSIRNNTLIIIMSDHGNARVNPLWPSLKGLLEFQMPMMYMVAPEWMDTKYSEEMRSLRLNAHERLVTTLDLHYTLRHLLNATAGNKSKLGSFVPSIKGQSLFKEVPKNRTCQDAGVPEYWCACLDNPRPVWENERAIIRSCTEQAFQDVNEHLVVSLRNVTLQNGTQQCGNWSLLEIKNAWLIKGPGFTGGRTKWQYGPRWGNDSHYTVSVTANPGGVPFQLGARYREWTGTCEVGLDHTTRRDQYDQHSKCIEKEVPSLKKWCYCI